MIKKIKEVLKKTFLYNIVKAYRRRVRKRRAIKLKEINEAFCREGIDVLKCFSDALMSEGLVFWLEFGTLLGCYREHDFIKHDFDLDTGAWYKDHERIKEVLEKNGFSRVRYYYVKDGEGIEECYKHNDYMTTIDVFYFFTEKEKSYCYGFNPLDDMRKRKNLNQIRPASTRLWSFPLVKPIMSSFKEIAVYVPEETEKHLIALYGETFMTPIPNFPVVGRPNLTEYTYEEKPACAFLKMGYF